MTVLQAFLRRLEGTFSDSQRRVREREAERLEIDATAWASLCSMNLDLLVVREAHRSASTLASVRRADREGEWELVSAQPGKLRSHPQSFRVGAHVEPAWDHATLRHRVAELVNTTRDAAGADPVRAIARFIRSFVRAQPFLAQNERVALIVASAVLRSLGLPAMAARETERVPEFRAALIAADESVMERFLEAALWSEALALAEWLFLTPLNPRWTLADEHAALASARVPMDLASAMDQLVGIVEPLLDASQAPRRNVHTTFGERARAATDAAYRGHPICPQHSILETRWPLPDGRDAVLVIALAGRGIAGASSVHLSIEHPRVVAAGIAPALLLPLDETPTNRGERLATWAPSALQRSGR
jgi:hypothetical protein